MSKPLISVATLALALAVALVFAPAAARADDTGDVLARLGETASCKAKSSVHRAWCPAVGWAKGKAGALKPGVMVGITVAIEADADIPGALTDRVTFVILAVRKDGKKLFVSLRDVKPENDAESEMMLKAVMGVAGVLKGVSKEVVLEKDLRAFADSLVTDAQRELTKSKKGWIWDTDDNHAELRQVGSAWVVIEASKSGGAGRFVTVLTSKVK